MILERNCYLIKKMIQSSICPIKTLTSCPVMNASIRLESMASHHLFHYTWCPEQLYVCFGMSNNRGECHHFTPPTRSMRTDAEEGREGHLCLAICM